MRKKELTTFPNSSIFQDYFDEYKKLVELDATDAYKAGNTTGYTHVYVTMSRRGNSLPFSGIGAFSLSDNEIGQILDYTILEKPESMTDEEFYYLFYIKVKYFSFLLVNQYDLAPSSFYSNRERGKNRLKALRVYEKFLKYLVDHLEMDVDFVSEVILNHMNLTFRKEVFEFRQIFSREISRSKIFDLRPDLFKEFINPMSRKFTIQEGTYYRDYNNAALYNSYILQLMKESYLADYIELSKFILPDSMEVFDDELEKYAR